MGFEHVGEAETLPADVTGVRLLASVSAAVPFHIGPACEALSTDLTDIWFLSWNRQKDERILTLVVLVQNGAHEMCMKNW